MNFEFSKQTYDAIFIDEFVGIEFSLMIFDLSNFLYFILFSFQATQRDDHFWTHTWNAIEDFEMIDPAEGVTVTSILGDYHNLADIFLTDSDWTEQKRSFGICFLLINVPI